MGRKRLPHRRLAEGEVTGHFHEATAKDAVLWETQRGMYLDAPNGSDVTHQEHHTVTIPPGQYDRLIVQEYDPFAEEIRNVVD